MDLTGSTTLPEYFISSSKASSRRGTPKREQMSSSRSRWGWSVVIPVGFWKFGMV